MPENAQSLIDHAAALVEAAKRAGADASDAVAVRQRSTSIQVRNGKVEGTDASEADDMSLRVFVGKKVASVSAATSSNPDMLAERAVAMARVSPDDAFNALADANKLATDFADLDLYDKTGVTAEMLSKDALEAETAALDVAGVSRSSGAGASAGVGGLVLVTSHGFQGSYFGTRFGCSVSVVAGEGTAMERDYDYSSRIYYNDLDSRFDIGKSAGDRAVKRLNPRKMPTQSVPIIFDPRVSRGILGHLNGAINGASVARKSSFLQEKMGKQIASEKITVIDDPNIVRGQASRPFDGEGVRGEKLTMVENGVLQHWYLSTSIGNELGLPTNGRGARGGTSVGASSTNVWMQPGDQTPDEMLKAIGTGFYVTEVFGQGVNMVTGEYSRGASGFWIENGEIAFPVSEVTIASNLKDMFMTMVPANDLDRNYSTSAPTILVPEMTLAGN
ncbi:TldD/PmbA family protein [Ahrensia marina]|uniref:Modulator protein n=1 Tax=Ahrensia marina TaxID=1514904 RepID=A0A0N0E8N8_9HYPH|nr:TldD/PmbA family protein [Ahrensia marina]KPB02571.1 modulator protein [Ahrensia marina]